MKQINSATSPLANLEKRRLSPFKLRRFKEALELLEQNAGLLSRLEPRHQEIITLYLLDA
jgi:hypothetical protein